MAPAGSPVYAAEGGVVTKLSGHDPAQGAVQGAGGPLGWSVYIRGKSGTEYYYTHLADRNVKVGQRVTEGQQIAAVADYDSYGRGSHLHLGVKSGGAYSVDQVVAAQPGSGQKPRSGKAPVPRAAEQPVMPEQAPAEIVPSPAAPPLPGPGAPQVNLEPPGSVVYTRDRPWANQNWQRLAQTNPASTVIQQHAYLAAYGMEDDDA
jgi:hypothetical protein